MFKGLYSFISFIYPSQLNVTNIFSANRFVLFYFAALALVTWGSLAWGFIIITTYSNMDLQ